MKYEIILALLSVPVIGGIVATRVSVRKRQQNAVKLRLAQLLDEDHFQPIDRVSLLKTYDWTSLDSLKKWVPNVHLIANLKSLLLEAKMDQHETAVVQTAVALLLFPPFIAFALGLNVFLGALLGLLLAGAPFIYVRAKAQARRDKFSEYLPDAIDLMVAVLRSGHSISESVHAVAREIPAPVGEEFALILHRMNLGQPLSESLLISAKKFRSYELDLMTRAVSIQSEVGGSLADLLEKTNGTLRERLKQARQLKVITSQSRLSATIVGLLPLVLAVALNMMTPGYLQLLVEDSLGRMLLIAAIMLELIGIYLMRRMSEMRV
ncbi:MAG TPA: type II secretion system F family protein [Chroococcales cyanobacterium]